METYGYIPNISQEQIKELDKLNMYKLICIDLTIDEVERIILEYLKDNLNLNLEVLDCTLNFDIVNFPENVFSYWELLNISIYQNDESYEEMQYVKNMMNSYFGKNTMYEISDEEYQLSSKKIFRMIFENAYPKPTNAGYALTVSYDSIRNFANSPACKYIL